MLLIGSPPEKLSTEFSPRPSKPNVMWLLLFSQMRLRLKWNRFKTVENMQTRLQQMLGLVHDKGFQEVFEFYRITA